MPPTPQLSSTSLKQHVEFGVYYPCHLLGLLSVVHVLLAGLISLGIAQAVISRYHANDFLQ